MSRWNDQLLNHKFKTAWNSLKELLDENGIEKNNDDQCIKELARLLKVTKYLDSVIEQIDPELMPISLFDALYQHTSTVIAELNNFKNNQNIGHLQNANTAIDSVISLFSQTPFILSGQQKGGLARAASAYASEIDKHLVQLRHSINLEIEGVQTTTKLIQTDLSQEQIALKELESQLQSVKQAIQNQTAEFNTQFQSSEKSRSDKFEVTITKLEQRVDDDIKRLSTKIDAEFEKLATKAGTTLAVLGKFQDDAAKVFGVVVNTLQAGAYSSYANEEKNTANILRWSAIALMLLGVTILVAPEIVKFIHQSEKYVLDWHMTLGRIPFSVILFVPAFYLARESNKHRSTEVLNRRRELILSTIDPYLALLDEASANKIKTEVAKGIFSDGIVQDVDSTTPEAGNLIAQIANLMKQVGK